MAEGHFFAAGAENEPKIRPQVEFLARSPPLRTPEATARRAGRARRDETPEGAPLRHRHRESPVNYYYYDYYYYYYCDYCYYHYYIQYSNDL